ncbi:hypothetical protein Pmar_PMAR014912 [Perkinsus marinus ATCC 50983]|uniref:Uncharacterized protein n=1 Tax=Perkinsus marinus (strain ATCC 50983 / TXsc) TaxID=423536 RepID=C5L590_PERM5|nr:hypothetical protein Pmar_PMAR014912 [Perkinsus marinus ATCC 50983]EER08149.1 hypothetical protein Pmar_PMAR014912 [Perkinsus marinus ATCC 50983]|eukprot:XP_002776333.1 hypothetical protein Pmar_PMAR014912 [Perkinsus marinus ATCC 50983]
MPTRMNHAICVVLFVEAARRFGDGQSIMSTIGLDVDISSPIKEHLKRLLL